MPLYWIEQETLEVINSGWLTTATQRVQDAEQGVVRAGFAAAALVAGTINYFWGSRPQGEAFPTEITFYDDVLQQNFTLSFAWTCSWSQDSGGGYPPAP